MIWGMKTLLISTGFLPAKREARLRISRKITSREKSTIFRSFYLFIQTKTQHIFVTSKTTILTTKKLKYYET